MAIRSDRPIYELLEKHLKVNPQPMTCADLMEIEEVRTEALNEFGGADRNVQLATNKLSDVLGLCGDDLCLPDSIQIRKAKHAFRISGRKRNKLLSSRSSPYLLPSLQAQRLQ